MAACCARAASRLRSEALTHPGGPSEVLLRDLLTYNLVAVFSASEPPLEAVMPVELDLGDSYLRLFNTLTTFGTPQDVMLQEMRIEMLFPADSASDAILQKWETHASSTRIEQLGYLEDQRPKQTRSLNDRR